MDHIEDALFDGTKEEMLRVICPECGGDIEYSVTKQEMLIRCTVCGSRSSLHGLSQTPNCINIFGSSHVFKS
jgi:DNA-directed RNA polymerase subunit RPC12/RpoP